MSSFTSPLIVSPLPDGRRWKLVRQFTYHMGSEYSKDVILVPYGFITDFASVPSFMWWLIPPWGKYGKAAVVHDYVYQHHAIKQGGVVILTFDRKMADKVFLEAMDVLGVRIWRKYPMYWAVRLFGGMAWR